VAVTATYLFCGGETVQVLQSAVTINLMSAKNTVVSQSQGFRNSGGHGPAVFSTIDTAPWSRHGATTCPIYAFTTPIAETSSEFGLLMETGSSSSSIMTAVLSDSRSYGGPEAGFPSTFAMTIPPMLTFLSFGLPQGTYGLAANLTVVPRLPDHLLGDVTTTLGGLQPVPENPVIVSSTTTVVHCAEGIIIQKVQHSSSSGGQSPRQFQYQDKSLVVSGTMVNLTIAFPQTSGESNLTCRFSQAPLAVGGTTCRVHRLNSCVVRHL
jgi:hypothetical protein